MVTLVTGATGFIGGRLVNELLGQGQTVRALVRDRDRARALGERGADLVVGDVTDAASVRAAASGVTHVFHCAAILGDSPNPDQRRVNVEGTRALLAGCVEAGVERLIYLSSLAVLGARHHYGTDESAPYQYARDGYTNSKIDAEKMVRDSVARRELEAVVLRPGFVYGPGDRLFLPRLIDGLVNGRFVYVGDGSKILNLVYIDDLLQALLLARDRREAAGQVYNLTDGTKTSLRQYVAYLSEQLGIQAPTRKMPPMVAWTICYVLEFVTWLRRSTEPPPLNITRMKFLYYNQDYSVEKLRQELGYAPRFTYREGLPAALAWLDQAHLLPVGKLAPLTRRG